MASLPPPPGGPGWAPAPARGAEPSRWTARAALLVAFLACVIGVIGWFRPVSAPPPTDPAPTYTAAEVQAAKDKVCDAFELVHKAVRVNMARDGGDDYATALAVAVNARQALNTGASYLTQLLRQYPQTPDELQEAVDELTESYVAVSIRFLAEEPKSIVQQSIDIADQATLSIEDLCK